MLHWTERMALVAVEKAHGDVDVDERMQWEDRDDDDEHDDGHQHRPSPMILLRSQVNHLVGRSIQIRRSLLSHHCESSQSEFT